MVLILSVVMVLKKKCAPPKSPVIDQLDEPEYATVGDIAEAVKTGGVEHNNIKINENSCYALAAAKETTICYEEIAEAKFKMKENDAYGHRVLRNP